MNRPLEKGNADINKGNMVKFCEAYKLANDYYVSENGAVYEAREDADNWMFIGKYERTTYGTSDVCVPKNGMEPFLFNRTDGDWWMIWNNGKVVDIEKNQC